MNWQMRILWIGLLSLPAICAGQTAELQALEGVRLVAHESNDGDSFLVEHGGREFPVRLYFVDCPETAADSETDARRVRGQTRYFGLAEHAATLQYGREAREFTRQRLEQPFRLHTAYATAPGRSVATRIYVFAVTADGEDLGSLLVEHGYARAYGVRRGTPGGVSHEEWYAMLSDLESAAMLDRRGIWALAESRRLVAMRAEDRREQAELKAVGEQDRQPSRLNLNTASPEALRRLPGVGAATAARIIANRPYRNADELSKVPRLSSAALASLTAYAVWEPAAK